jgi:hypothetical protein
MEAPAQSHQERSLPMAFETGPPTQGANTGVHHHGENRRSQLKTHTCLRRHPSSSLTKIPRRATLLPRGTNRDVWHPLPMEVALPADVEREGTDILV